jgi:Mrp family chromosome partitioning ATPase
MSAGLGVLRRVFTLTGFSRPQPAVLKQAQVESESLDFCQPQCASEREIRRLVRMVFLPGWPRPAHQVVVSGVDADSDGSAVCIGAGELLAREGGGKVCLVEANLRNPSMEESFGGTCSDGAEVGQTAGAMRKSSRQIQNNLWLVPRRVFFGHTENSTNLAWLRSRLGELRREFDYSIIHGSLAGEPGGSSLIAHLVDGLVLTVDAKRTRRVTALRVREQLLASNVRLVGAVLLDRSFPIPERIYRRI